MKQIALVLVAFAFIGCSNQTPRYTTACDQRLRQQLFCDCLKSIPKAPETMGKSDWSKVVEKCSDYAYYASFRVVPADSAVGGVIK
jgi:hypothetical protein